MMVVSRKSRSINNVTSFIKFDGQVRCELVFATDLTIPEGQHPLQGFIPLPSGLRPFLPIRGQEYPFDSLTLYKDSNVMLRYKLGDVTIAIDYHIKSDGVPSPMMAIEDTVALFDERADQILTDRPIGEAELLRGQNQAQNEAGYQLYQQQMGSVPAPWVLGSFNREDTEERQRREEHESQQRTNALENEHGDNEDYATRHDRRGKIRPADE